MTCTNSTYQLAVVFLALLKFINHTQKLAFIYFIPRSWLQLKTMVIWKHCDTGDLEYLPQTHFISSIRTVTQWKPPCFHYIPVYRHCYQSTQVPQLSWYPCMMFSWGGSCFSKKRQEMCFCVLQAFLIHLFLSCPSNYTARADPRHGRVSQESSVIALTGVFLDIKVI